MNSEAWIFIRVQCVIYQWVRLNKFYKLMKSFFKFQILFSELLAEKQKIFERISMLEMNIDQSAMRYISMDSTRQALQANEKLFQILELFFKLVLIFLDNLDNS